MTRRAFGHGAQVLAVLFVAIAFLGACSSAPTSRGSDSSHQSLPATNDQQESAETTESTASQEPAESTSARAPESAAPQTPSESAALQTPAMSVTEQAPAAVSPTTSVITGSDADLGLVTPITQPACDGTGVVVISTFSDPATYAKDVSLALEENPSAQYMRADLSCPSFAATTVEGNQIYIVYIAVGPEKDQVCKLVGDFDRRDVFGKWLDRTSSPNETIQC